MAEVPTEEVGTGSSTEGDISDQQQQCLSSESLAEWRSSEQLENGTPSTSPPYWDSDDNDGGPKPAELYGKYTWKIDKFSQINKRELRSNPFEIGGYKWMEPFCTIYYSCGEQRSKKSKYSDTLHRFWKKEHDWGWKKFMELSKVFDGFIDSDTLIIKAQVQVIRERADRPFRCLDCQYRRELIRVYLTNVEQICRRFVEERRNKLGKLIEDKVRWSSFCAFWRSMDPRSRCHMSQEKTESILKLVVKHFFTEKEVTSTLVMDSLYSGLKALEGPYKGRKNKSKFLDSADLPVPIIRMEKDMFVLDDDVLPLLQRSATAPLPPKDDTGPQNRSKDGAVGGEFNKNCIERDEKRLTELGRWTIEIFILAHMFSKIEVAYQEAVALKKQEELIREEEAAWHAGNDHRSRRGAADKEKKPKKKQGKQKRNSRKGKDKARDEKARCIVQMEMEQDRFSVKSEDVVNSNEDIEEKCVAPADVSDVSDSVDCAPEKITPYSEERDVSPVNWDTDTSEAHPPPEASSSGVSGPSTMQNGTKAKGSIADDSSSTSSDLISSMPQISKSQLNKSKKPARRRGRSHNVKQIFDSSDLIGQENNHPSESAHVAGQPKHVGGTSKSNGIAPTPFAHASHDIVVNGFEHPVVKEQEASFGHKNVSVKDPNAEASEVTSTVSKEVPSPATQKLVKVDVSSSSVIRKKSSSDSPKKSNTPTSSAKSVENVVASKTNIQKCTAPKATEKTSRDAVHLRSEKAQPASVTVDKLAVPPVPIVSRPCSAPIVPSSKVNVSTLSMAPTPPALARSASVAGRLSPESFTSSAQSYVPLSYRNAMMGGPASGSSRPYSTIQSSTAVVNSSVPYTQGAPLVSAPMFAQYESDRMDMNQLKTALPFGMLNHDPLQKSRSLQLDSSQRDVIRNLPGEVVPQSQDRPSRNIHVSPEEFPHLDIINDLLDDENGVMDTSMPESDYQSFRNTHNRPHFASNLYGFLDDTALSSGAGPSTGLCRFKRTPSPIDERFHYSYPDGTSTEALQDMIPHSSLHPYDNGQLGLVPNQWQVSGSERPFLNTRSSDDTYLYHLLGYQNMGTGSSGFPGYRSSNGL